MLCQDLTVPKLPDRSDFESVFSAGAQLDVMRNRPLCFFGLFPNLEQVNVYYNANVAQSWIIRQLEDLNAYAKELEPMNSDQLEQLAFVIVDKYGYLKVTEILLFFFEVKAGTYGHFFGKVSPMRIMEFLKEFEVTRYYANEKRIKESEALYYEERKKYTSYQPERLKRIGDALSQRQPKKQRKTENKVNSTVLASINSFLSNAYGLSDADKKAYEEAFKKNHGCSIYEYIACKRNDQ